MFVQHVQAVYCCYTACVACMRHAIKQPVIANGVQTNIHWTCMQCCTEQAFTSYLSPLLIRAMIMPSYSFNRAWRACNAL